MDSTRGDGAAEPGHDEGAAVASGSDLPGWWHRDHPTFTPLSGFFTGLLFVVVVPGAYAALLGAMFDTGTAEDLFPFVLVALAVPIGLLVAPRTRTFGKYMALGIVATALVVGGVTAGVLWYLVNYQS